MHEKLTRCPNFTRFLPEKYFSRFFWGGGGKYPLPPVSYAYVSECFLADVFGVVLRCGRAHFAPDLLVAPDSKASWKNVGLYGVRIFRFWRIDKMDSTMKRLTGQFSPTQNFRARTAPWMCSIVLITPLDGDPLTDAVTSPRSLLSSDIRRRPTWLLIHRFNDWQAATVSSGTHLTARTHRALIRLRIRLTLSAYGGGHLRILEDQIEIRR